MDFFKDYTRTIQEAINNPDKLSKAHDSRYSNFDDGLSGPEALNESKLGALIGSNETLTPETSLKALAEFMGIQKIPKMTFGTHPDFKHLEGTEDYEMHYVTSMFVDIKGSTNLHKKYSLEQINIITNTVLIAAIHTCSIFGGHIQRLQGDGIFVYFGGRNVDKDDSARAAVKAASFFTFFIKNDLKNIFEEDGIDNINTRTGIDFGDDEDVMWSEFGVGNCTEVTTTSLHTSLATKMQNNAKQNGIMVGEFIKNRVDLDTDLFDLLRDKDGNIDGLKRYVFEDSDNNFRYTQYTFDWEQYLNTYHSRRLQELEEAEPAPVLQSAVAIPVVDYSGEKRYTSPKPYLITIIIRDED